MFIIWQGKGWLVVVVTVVCSTLLNLVLDALLGKGYYDSHMWWVAIALFLAAGATWFIASYLNERSASGARVLIDKKTGKEINFKPRHSLFSISIDKWPIILGLIGIVVLITSLFNK